jgi:hypothetical protein
MDAPLSFPIATNDREQRWKTFQQALSDTLEHLARKRFWFLASLFLPGIIFSLLENILFGPVPKEGIDPYAASRTLLSLASVAFLLFLSVGMVNVTRLWINQQEAGWSEIFQTPFLLWLKELGVLVLFFLGSVIGFLFLVIPGIWFILTYQFALTALAANPSLSIWETFQKSKSLTAGNRWKIFVTSFVVTLRFWWRKGGKWALWATLVALGIFILTTLTSGATVAPITPSVKMVGFVAAALGFVGIFGLVVTGIYTAIATQYTLNPLIFFGLTNKPENARIAEVDPETPSPQSSDPS